MQFDNEVLMNMSKYAILAFSIALTSCATIPRADLGGRMKEYAEKVKQIQKTGERVVIDYECDSACLIKLSSGSGLRVSKIAKFGVHETRFVLPEDGYFDPASRRSEDGTEHFKTLLPECAVKLFESKHAFDRPTLIYFSGEEVLKSCPQIKEYVSK